MDFSDLTDIDATDLLDKAAQFTSNLGAVLHGVIDAGEQGVEVLLENLRPLAEQADAFLGDRDNPIPAPPEGGVPVDLPLGDPANAAATVGVVPASSTDPSSNG